MSRRKKPKKAVACAIALPAPYGERGYSSWPERERVRQMLERDRQSEAASKKRHKSFGTFDMPANPANAVAINPNDPAERHRYRALPGDHPLVRAWANEKIDAAMFNAGNIYRLLFEKANDPAGQDCTQAMFVNRSAAGDRTSLRMAEAETAGRSLARIERRITAVEAKIVRAFCGRAISANAAVNGVLAYRCPPDGVWNRMREVLASLAEAIRKAGVPRGHDDGAVAEFLRKSA